MNSEEFHQVSLSKEVLSDLIRTKLYSLGYGRKEGEFIDDIDIPVDELMPVHFWVKGDREEVFEEFSSKDGKIP